VDDESRGADSADTGGTDGTEAHETDGADTREPRTTDAHTTGTDAHGAFASWLLQVFAREDDERPSGS